MTSAESVSNLSSTGTNSKGDPAWYAVVGITLAISSGVFIGASYILKKKGLIDATNASKKKLIHNSHIIENDGQKLSKQQTNRSNETGPVNKMLNNPNTSCGLSTDTLINEDESSSSHTSKDSASNTKGTVDDEGGSPNYLKSPMWWLGLFLMAIGEAANFAAYSFTPAILVTPMGAISVVVSAILSSIVLKEYLNFSGKIGCGLCVIGATLIVIHSPATNAVATIPEFMSSLISPGFLVYFSIMILVTLYLVYSISPRYGNSQPIVYISICSIIGSFLVTAIEGFGAAIVHSSSHWTTDNQFLHWQMYMLVLFIIFTICLEIHFLNLALTVFSTAIVTPIYYVFFTSTTLITSAIFHKGFPVSNVVSGITLLMGFLVIFAGVALLFQYNLEQMTLNTITTIAEPAYKSEVVDIETGGRGFSTDDEDDDDDEHYDNFDDNGDLVGINTLPVKYLGGQTFAQPPARSISLNVETRTGGLYTSRDRLDIRRNVSLDMARSKYIDQSGNVVESPPSTATGLRRSQDFNSSNLLAMIRSAGLEAELAAERERVRAQTPTLWQVFTGQMNTKGILVNPNHPNQQLTQYSTSHHPQDTDNVSILSKSEHHSHQRSRQPSSEVAHTAYPMNVSKNMPGNSDPKDLQSIHIMTAPVSSSLDGSPPALAPAAQINTTHLLPPKKSTKSRRKPRSDTLERDYNSNNGNIIDSTVHNSTIPALTQPSSQSQNTVSFKEENSMANVPPSLRTEYAAMQYCQSRPSSGNTSREKSESKSSGNQNMSSTETAKPLSHRGPLPTIFETVSGSNVHGKKIILGKN